MKRILYVIAIFTMMPCAAVTDNSIAVVGPKAMPTPSAPPAPSDMAPAYPSLSSALPGAPGGPAASAPVNPSAQKLSRELNEERAKTTEQKAQLEANNREIATLKKEKDALIRERKNLEARLQETKEAVQAAQVPDSQDSALRSEIERLRIRINEFTLSIAAKDFTISTLNTQKRALEECIREKNSEIAVQEAQIRKLATEKNNAVALSLRHDSTILGLRREQSSLNVTIENLRTTVIRLEAKKEALEQENIRLHGRTFDEITRELQKRKDDLQKDINYNNHQITLAQETLSRVNMHIEQQRALSRSELGQHTVAKQAIQAEHKQFVQALDALRATPEGRIEATLASNKQRIQTLQSELAAEQRSKNAAVAQINSLRSHHRYELIGSVAASATITALLYAIAVGHINA